MVVIGSRPEPPGVAYWFRGAWARIPGGGNETAGIGCIDEGVGEIDSDAATINGVRRSMGSDSMTINGVRLD